MSLRESVLISGGAGLPAICCTPSCARVDWCAAVVCRMHAAGAGSSFAEAVVAAPHAARAEGALVVTLFPSCHEQPIVSCAVSCTILGPQAVSMDGRIDAGSTGGVPA